MLLPFAQYYKQKWSLNVICKGLPILFLIALLTYHGFQLPWYRLPVKPLILCIKFQIWEIEYFINTYSLEYWKFYLDDVFPICLLLQLLSGRKIEVSFGNYLFKVKNKDVRATSISHCSRVFTVFFEQATKG